MHQGIERIEAFSVLGVVIRVTQGSETSELFSGIWEEFEHHGQWIESVSTGKQYYGVNFPTEAEHVSDYLAGMRIADDIPETGGLVKRRVPGGNYAIFECPVEGIGECYQQIFSVWLPSARVCFVPEYPVFEEYPEKGSSLPVRIYVPVNKKDKP
jgi:predicted transcriptional regulator YdeE